MADFWAVVRVSVLFSFVLGSAVSADGGAVLQVRYVFRQERLADADAMRLRDGRMLYGKILNEVIGIATPYGTLDVPTRKAAAFSFESTHICRDVLVTTDFSRVSGSVTTSTFRFCASESETETIVSKDDIHAVWLRRLDVEGKRSGKGGDGPVDVLELVNGDVLTGRVAERALKVVGLDGQVGEQSFDELESVEARPIPRGIVCRRKDYKQVYGALITDGFGITLAGTDVAVGIDRDQWTRLLVDCSWEKVSKQLGTQYQSSGVRQPDLTAEDCGELITNTIGMQLALIPAGEFVIGSPADEPGRQPNETQQVITLTRAFYMGCTEVTQEQWETVMGNNPSMFKGRDRPVENVRWGDAVEFCERLSAREGKRYRLPTEAEWEYACRAGTTTAYNRGEALAWDQACFDCPRRRRKSRNPDEVRQHMSVRNFRPNAWYLFDMHGNVWEWCQDWYGERLSEPVTDPGGPAEGVARVRRGGSWGSAPSSCRSAFRYWRDPNDPGGAIGFRVVLDAQARGSRGFK